ncbi:MAG: NAD(P)/FAD-dependent oxidoreductase [Minisyncoccia bacterium]
MENNILIVGGGFAGVTAARELAKKSPKSKITLISNRSYFEYYPALYRILSGMSPIEVCIPLEDVLPENVIISKDNIVSIDPQNKQVTGELGAYQYDELVLALGSEVNYFGIKDAPTNTYRFGTTNSAIELKNRMIDLFKEYVKEEDPKHKLHVVVVGGGPVGVELSGALSIFMHRLANRYNVDRKAMKVTLVDSGPRVLGRFPEKVSKHVQNRLSKIGVNLSLGCAISDVQHQQVCLPNENLLADTIVWTAGTKPNSLYKDIPGIVLDEKTKRVVVDEFLCAKGLTNVYVVGDGAATPNSGLAQTAVYDGKYVAQVITSRAKKISDTKIPKYKVPVTGYIVPVGMGWAAFVFKKLRMYGFIPFVLRMAVDFEFLFRMLPLARVLDLYWEGFRYRVVETIKR